MAHPLSAILVHQVAEDFINGNTSDVKKVIAGLKGVNAAYLSVVVYNILPAQERASFLKLLQSWAE